MTDTGTKKRGVKRGSKINRYPGLSDNIVKLLTDADEPKPLVWLMEQMPEVKKATLSRYLKMLKDKRVVSYVDKGVNTKYILAPAHVRNGKKSAVLAVAETAPEIFEGGAANSTPKTTTFRSALFSKRQIESIILRMENINEMIPAFTPLDFDTMRQIVRLAR